MDSAAAAASASPAASGPALRDAHLVSLAQTIPDSPELLHVGTAVLDVPAVQIQAAIYSSKSITEAAYHVLSVWRRGQSSAQQAYANLRQGLLREKKMQMAALLDTWVLSAGLEGVSVTSPVSQSRLQDIQRWTRESLRSKPFSLVLGKQWTRRPGPGTDLRHVYTNLTILRRGEWPSREPDPRKSAGIRATSEILDPLRLGVVGPARILVEGQGGVGKSTLLKRLALGWADATDADLAQFDYVFHLALNQVKTDSPIETHIVAQHRGLKAKKVQPKEIGSILEGDTKNKVLILLDGYDEYKPGTCTSVDEALAKESLWDCWVVLTSRDTEQSEAITDYMDAHFVIWGFNRCQAEEYMTKFLGDKGKMYELFQQASKAELTHSLSVKPWSPLDTGILQVPIFLHMVCVIFQCNSSLPERKTQIFEAIADRCMDREALRVRGQKAVDSAREAFVRLGRLAWTGLNEPTKRLVFEKEEVLAAAGPEALELGLLFGTESPSPQEEQTDALSFGHLLLQEFAAGKFLAEQSEESLKTILSSAGLIQENPEPVRFACGLSRDPRSIVELVCEKFAESAKSAPDERKLWEIHGFLQKFAAEIPAGLDFDPLCNKYISVVNEEQKGSRKRSGVRIVITTVYGHGCHTVYRVES